MAKSVILFFILLNIVYVWSSPHLAHLINKRDFYCGPKLTKALSLVCQGNYNSPSKKSLNDLLVYNEYDEIFPVETDDDNQESIKIFLSLQEMGKTCCTGSISQANALTMAILSLLLGIFLVFVGIYFLYFLIFEKTGYLLIGIMLTISGTCLLVGIFQDKKKCILFYLIVGSLAWFIVTIFIVIHEISNRNFKKGHSVLFLTSLFLFLSSLWCCQFSVYQFYKKIREYNDTTISENTERTESTELILQ